MIDHRQRIANSGRSRVCSHKLHVRILFSFAFGNDRSEDCMESWGRVERRRAMVEPSARTTVVLHAVCRVCRAGSYAPAQG